MCECSGVLDLFWGAEHDWLREVPKQNGCYGPPHSTSAIKTLTHWLHLVGKSKRVKTSCWKHIAGWLSEEVRVRGDQDAPHFIRSQLFHLSALSPHFLTLGALVWDPGDVSEWAGLCFCFCPPNRSGGNIAFDGETSLQPACRVQYPAFSFSLTLCHLSRGYVDIVYLSSQANKLWQKEHRFHRSDSKNAMVVIIITVITACSFFFPQSAKQFS